MATGLKSITQQELADQLGVSRQAVSFAVSGTGRLSESVRKRIVTAALKAGYRPNAAARAMQRGRFEQIAFVLDTQSSRSLMPADLLDGIHGALDNLDWGLVLSRWEDAAFQDAQGLPKAVREMMVDGLILNYHASLEFAPELLKRYDIPCVWINRMAETDCVRPDDEGAGQALTERLLAQGAQHIVYLDSQVAAPQRHYSRSARERGYCTAMDAAGLPPRIVRMTGTAMREQIAVLETQLMAPGVPDAVVAYSPYHLLALQTYVLPAHGIRPVLDMPLASFAEDQSHADLAIGLKAVCSWRDIGETAVAMLKRKIESPGEVLPAETVPYRMIEPDTAAATGDDDGSLCTIF